MIRIWGSLAWVDAGLLYHRATPRRCPKRLVEEQYVGEKAVVESGSTASRLKGDCPRKSLVSSSW